MADGRGREPGGEFSRRRFLVAGAAAVGAAAAAGLPALGQGQTAAANTRGRVLHIIGHSHIDAAWLWPWRDGSNLVLTTMRSALDRMKETPEFRYSHSSATHYRWVEPADPKMFEEIKARVREGRWEVVGGWLATRRAASVSSCRAAPGAAWLQSR